MPVSRDKDTDGMNVTLALDMRGKWLLASGVAVLAGVAAGALSWYQRQTAAASFPPPKVAAPAPNQVTLSGKIRAQKVVPVGSMVNGTIEAFLADVGQEVGEGQILARISNHGLETGREMAAIALD